MMRGISKLLARGRVGSGALLLVLFGCGTPAERPPPPPVQVPGHFEGSLPGGHEGVPVPEAPPWWTQFNDPVLDGIIGDALAQNLTVRSACARLAEVRAVRDEKMPDRQPSVQAVIDASQFREPKDRDAYGRPPTSLLFSGFDASWELDLFGRLGYRQAAAQADVRAEEAEQADVAVTVAAEIARDYFELRGQQLACAAQRHLSALRERELRDMRSLQGAGRANLAEVRDLEYRTNAEAADLPQHEAAARMAIYRLSVLTGKPPASLLPLLADPGGWKPEPRNPGTLAPADLLRRRPDLRRAEQELIASTALEKSAAADLFPRVGINGQLSFSAYSWSIGPYITWEVFNRRRVHARQSQAGARVDAAFARYQAAVLNSFLDVESSLALLSAARARRDALAAAGQDLEASIGLSQRRTELGVGTRLETSRLERERSEGLVELALQEATVRESWVGIFKAFDGGVAGPERK